VLREDVAYARDGARRIVGSGLDQDGDAVRCITLVKDLLEIRGVLAGIRAAGAEARGSELA